MSSNSPRPIAVVTGASGGMGRAIGNKLAGQGFDIFGVYNSRTADAVRAETEIRALGGDCIMVQADLRAADSVAVLVAAIDEYLENNRGKTLRALVNSAAMMLGPTFDTATPDQFDSYFAVNTRAPFFLSQQIAARMHEGGSIVNISSAGVHFSSSSDIVYAMSKAALEALTYHSAENLASRNIRVNTLIPGFTDNGHELFNVAEARNHMGSFAVLGGVTSTSTVAEAVFFLVSEASNRTTGSTLDVSGGSTLGTRRRSGPDFSLRDNID